jgi:peptide methionine sulfoxide reductase MsrA
VLKQYQTRLANEGYGTIVTKVKALTQFFPAEDHHQDNLVKNPNGY